MSTTLKKTKRNFVIFAFVIGLVLLLSHILLSAPLTAEMKKKISSWQLKNKFAADWADQSKPLLIHKNPRKVQTDRQTVDTILRTQMLQILGSDTSKDARKLYSNASSTTGITTSPIRMNKPKAEVFQELKKLALGIDSKFQSLSGHGIETFLKNDFPVRIEAEGANNVTTRPDTCTSCTRTDFSYLINNERICEHPLQLIIFIFSSPSAFFQRQSIRDSWGSVCGKYSLDSKCVFVLGNTEDKNVTTKISEENQKKRDILQVNFKDAYANLTHKTLSCLKWFSEFCSTTKYLMKTDDDVYVNLELILKMLPAAPSKKFLGGYCWGMSEPHRETESKWYVSKTAYRGSRFPPMCSGTGYIMSADAAKDSFVISKNIPFFYLEDVYIALCATRIRVNPVNLLGFNNVFVQFEACHYRNNLMTSHQVDAFQLREFWEQSHKCLLTRNSTDIYRPIPYPILA